MANKVLFEADPDQGQMLDATLVRLHDNIAGVRLRSVYPLKHTAQVRDWELTLYSSEVLNRLDRATAIRLGQEAYRFSRTEEGLWYEQSGNHLFGEAHFYNLVTMATQSGLKWETTPFALTA